MTTSEDTTHLDLHVDEMAEREMALWCLPFVRGCTQHRKRGAKSPTHKITSTTVDLHAIALGDFECVCVGGPRRGPL